MENWRTCFAGNAIGRAELYIAQAFFKRLKVAPYGFVQL